MSIFLYAINPIKFRFTFPKMRHDWGVRYSFYTHLPCGTCFLGLYRSLNKSAHVLMCPAPTCVYPVGPPYPMKGGYFVKSAYRYFQISHYSSKIFYSLIIFFPFRKSVPTALFLNFSKYLTN